MSATSTTYSTTPPAPCSPDWAILPKKSALTAYSYRLSHEHQRNFLAALDTKMIAAGLLEATKASSTWTSTPSGTGAATPPWKSTTCPPDPNAPARC